MKIKSSSKKGGQLKALTVKVVGHPDENVECGTFSLDDEVTWHSIPSNPLPLNLPANLIIFPVANAGEIKVVIQ